MRYTNIAIGRTWNDSTELDINPIDYCYPSSVFKDLEKRNGTFLQPITNGICIFIAAEHRGSVFVNELHPLFNAAVLEKLDGVIVDTGDELRSQIHYTFFRLKSHIIDMMPSKWIEHMIDK